MSAHLESFKNFLKTREKASQSYVSGDGAPLVRISAAKSPATFFSPGGDATTGAKKIAARYKKDAEIFESADENKFETLQMNADENIAFWVGLQKSIVRMKGKKQPIPMTLRVTEIFRRDDGNWKMIHRHADFLKTDEEK
jgi:ketosteroid isomerase-like protein